MTSFVYCSRSAFFFATDALQLVVDLRVEEAERVVLELALDPVDAEAVRERRVDVERLLRDLALALRRRGAPSVRMLCVRSASFTRMTRMSRAIASSILRKFSACFSSREVKLIWPIFVTPSTSAATSGAEELARSGRASRACPRPCRAAARSRRSGRRAACRR